MKIGILSDAHGLTSAFERALTILDGQCVDKIYFIGDAVGYVPGTGVVEKLLELNIQSILGNHDLALLDKNYLLVDDQIYQLGLTDEMLKPNMRSWLSTWPRSMEFTLDDYQLMLVHGSPAHPTNGYIYPDTDLTETQPCGADFVFMGHTHRPFIRKYGETVYVNVGSCSLPRDGGGWGAVATFDSANGNTEIHRFDIKDCLLAANNDQYPPHVDVTSLAHRQLSGQLIGKIIDKKYYLA